MPTALNSLRSFPVHFGHSVRESSLNDCTCSKRWSHSVQAYW
ncbi:hypothetical protein SAMN05421805_11072 [Saccharopolyspora antimicrobica]|uniref:Uncharacterized protein n=2 Tax=Saccharopolyspora TaxID=1835 RepID=A0A1H6D442_9PSEU|nr:hypothetical protein SAMN02982929_03949 [Saccharopolyspora kobensis]SFD10550.1 hypothetical protein SAMN05216506_102544 [Saccharopolyspora kobensis]SFO15885.1 hypothetical protein SAMN05421805_11072 [Saccharopolyspora antimicrobica]